MNKGRRDDMHDENHHHDHGHSHEHGHSHHHQDDKGKEMSPQEEFKLRITRWRDHNREHQQTLVEWRDKIRDQGLEDTAGAMDRAAEFLRQSVAELDKALDSLG